MEFVLYGGILLYGVAVMISGLYIAGKKIA